MAEYRRFIAYIYEYTNGKKNKNTGFAKVESRNGICRMQVHLQNIPQEESSLNVYGFVRKGEWLLGIFLGSTAVQGQMGDAKIVTPADKIGNTGYRLDQLAGLWVESGFGRKYITLFDEGKVDTEKLVTELPKTRMEQETAEETVQEPVLSPEAVNDAENLTRERTQQKADPAPENRSDDGLKPVSESKREPGAGLVSKESLDSGRNLISESVQPAADASVEEVQDSGANQSADGRSEEGVEPETIYESGVNRTVEDSSEAGMEAETVQNNGENRPFVGHVDAEQKFEMNKNSEENRTAEGSAEAELESEMVRNSGGKRTSEDSTEGEQKTEMARNSGENQTSEDSTEAEQESEMVRNSGENWTPDLHTDGIDSEEKGVPEVKAASSEQLVHTQEAAACLRSNQQCQRQQQNCQSGFDQRWQCMSKRYPHFKPFQDDEIADCIQIMPKDLRLLQQGNWRMGNNSFLMHGYYNYRHLLLGKKKEGGYILGIPGLYENQELFMANMFGFPDFKDAPGQKKNGRFGYWCRTLA